MLIPSRHFNVSSCGARFIRLADEIPAFPRMDFNFSLKLGARELIAH